MNTIILFTLFFGVISVSGVVASLSVNDLHYIGCFHFDDFYWNSDSYSEYSLHWTLRRCHQRCLSMGRDISGIIKSFDFCYCDRFYKVDLQKKSPDDKCSFTCREASHLTCGGDETLYMSVYTTDKATASPDGEDIVRPTKAPRRWETFTPRVNTLIPNTSMQTTSTLNATMMTILIENATMPKAAMPTSSMPNATISDTSMLTKSTLNATMTATSIRNDTVPTSSIPNATMPKAAMPTTSMPNATMSDTSMLTKSTLNATMTTTSIRNDTVPTSSIPNATKPNNSMPIPVLYNTQGIMTTPRSSKGSAFTFTVTPSRKDSPNFNENPLNSSKTKPHDIILHVDISCLAKLTIILLLVLSILVIICLLVFLVCFGSKIQENIGITYKKQDKSTEQYRVLTDIQACNLYISSKPAI